ncbi:MAG TPA: carboxymuconolactone decarboxylase family protein [Polyangia bacterium]|nr:carboxymuconolactone decarboxylase family protein [Polyangia bacterium]
MKTIEMTMVTMVALAGVGAAAPAHAESASAAAAKADMQRTFGFVPSFVAKMPEEQLPGLWEEVKTLQMNPVTALNGKTKELIGLGVAAQIPCRYCIVAHSEFAKLNGATDKELGEAVAMASITRHWSTYLNGIQTDEAKFRGEIAKVLDNVKSGRAGKGAPVTVTDGASALREATNMMGGYAPEFIQRFPDVARAGAWKQMRDVQLSPTTALSGKQKELVGLAVAAQIPCRFCIIAHTEFAKLNGATDAEINEAVAMAALTRDMSTFLNGMQVDEAQFRRDIDHLVRGAKAEANATAKAAAKSTTAKATAQR